MINFFKKNKKSFLGKTVLITGSSRGFGAKIAMFFCKSGANVIINYLGTEEEQAQKTIKQLKKINKRCMLIKADVSNRKEVEEMMIKGSEEFNNIDILINNAAVFLRPTSWLDMSEEDFNKTINVNLKGVYECCRAAFPFMKKNMSKIINMSTLGGDANVAAYILSKIAVNHLTKVFAKEFAPNINVNAIAFGKIEIGMGKPDNKKQEKYYISETPLKRLGNSTDIIKAISFLASKDSDFITGDILLVDGGRSIRTL